MFKQRIPLALSYDDVLLVPQFSDIGSRADVDLTTQISPHVKIRLPLISINMTDVTGVEMSIAIAKLGGLGFLPRFIPIEKEADMVYQVKKANLQVGAAVGIKNYEWERVEALAKAGADIITVDVAHGQMQKAIDFTRRIKQKFGNSIDIISGVVATYEGACSLFKAGADSVRVGVGPGTICVTRVVTGCGVPQITALLEASRAARKFGRTILCDGGTKNHGDIVKGLAAGASAVIIGSQFAGCSETPGKLVIKKGLKYKTYNASTSFTEKNNHNKNLNGNSKSYVNHIEGVESIVPFKGPLENTVKRMDANIRSGLSYCGAYNIPQLWKKAHFIQVTSMGVRESEPHGVIVRGRY